MAAEAKIRLLIKFKKAKQQQRAASQCWLKTKMSKIQAKSIKCWQSKAFKG